MLIHSTELAPVGLWDHYVLWCQAAEYPHWPSPPGTWPLVQCGLCWSGCHGDHTSMMACWFIRACCCWASKSWSGPSGQIDKHTIVRDDLIYWCSSLIYHSKVTQTHNKQILYLSKAEKRRANFVNINTMDFNAGSSKQMFTAMNMLVAKCMGLDNQNVDRAFAQKRIQKLV